MKISANRIILRLILFATFLSGFGCAQQMKSVQTEAAPEASNNAEIRSITVSDDSDRIEIVADRPFVYTYYSIESPPRLVVDIAQATAGTLVLPIEVNRGKIKRIDVAKHEFGSGILSRIDIALTENINATAALDPQDKRRLIINTRPATSAKASTPQTSSPSSGESKQPEQKPVVTFDTSEKIPAAEPKQTVTGKAMDASPVEPSYAAPQSSPPPTVAARTGEMTLTGISKGADGITLELPGGIPSFKAFRLNQPDRLVIDLFRIKNGILSKSVEINGFNLSKARIGEGPDKLRIVFDSIGGSIPKYAVTKNDKGLFIVFGENAAKVASIPESSVPVQPASPVPVETRKYSARQSSGPGMVEAVEFSQHDGISRITIKTSGNCTVSEPVKTAKGYNLAIKACRLPAKLQRQLDTSAFESVIREIVPYPVKSRKSSEARIAVTTASAPNQLKRERDELRWEFKEPARPVRLTRPAKSIKPVSLDSSSAPAEKEFTEVRPEEKKTKTDKMLEEAFALDKSVQAQAKPGKQYTGRKVSLEFSDADIRKIFQLLAEVSNQNFLVSDDVTGTISLKLINVPWDQALDVILENKGLGMQKDGNIVQIRPKTKMKSLDDEAIEMRLTEEKKMPLSTVIFDVNFATIGEIETQFRTLKSKRPDASISTDARTNKIIVVDIEPNIKKMKNLLDSLDVPEKQVMIEARIVEASTNFARDIGVKWNFGYQDGSASIANINNLTSSMGGVVTNVLPTGTTGGIAAGMSFGKLISNIQLDMRLSAASTVGQVKIISTPKVLTVNNKAAKISQGQMVPYQNTSSAEGAKTEFIEAALSLEVTPHITADGSVNMKIRASNNSVGSGSPPPINKKEATTELVVKNGETTVIGGIYVDSETEGDTGVPYLSDIPLLGWLFKSNSKNKTKNELLIFITPKIMS